MLQLVYISSVSPAGPPADVRPILETSRRNNRRDSITGLLYADNARFLQALEGPDDKVEAAFARIKADPRHRAVVILSRRPIEAREFGEWEMAHRPVGGGDDMLMQRIALLVRGASANVRATFEGFAQVRRAA